MRVCLTCVCVRVSLVRVFVHASVRACVRAGVRALDPFEMTRQRLSDSVDSIHFGKTTNSMLVQVN